MIFKLIDGLKKLDLKNYLIILCVFLFVVGCSSDKEDDGYACDCETIYTSQNINRVPVVFLRTCEFDASELETLLINGSEEQLKIASSEQDCR